MDRNYGNHTFFNNCHTARLQTHVRSHHASGARTSPERMGHSLHDQAALELCVARRHFPSAFRREKSAAIYAPPCAGSHANGTLKCPGKVALVREAAFQRNVS
jgi:hypothetical protein